MSDAPVPLLSHGPPETVLPPEPSEIRAALAAAADSDDPVGCRGRGPALAGRSAWRRGPPWARPWSRARATPALAYAAFRTGYHRGLDRLRASGWRGSGYVRWAHESNRGFLRALSGLQRVAAGIGEIDEAERCALFLLQLDPGWPPPDAVAGPDAEV